MTNETDLRECSAQIEIIGQLINQPETFDLDKIFVELKTKLKLLTTFKPRSYSTILKGLGSGELKHPGKWVKPPKAIEPPKPKKPKIDKKAIALEKELQETKDKLAELEVLKELEKEEDTEILKEGE